MLLAGAAQAEQRQTLRDDDLGSGEASDDQNPDGAPRSPALPLSMFASRRATSFSNR